MALISSLNAPKYEIPHEPGEWMRIRGLKASDQILIQRDYATPAERELALLKAIVIEWSYEADVTPEAIDDLDSATLAWLDSEVLPALLNVQRSDDEKKASSNGLSSTPSRPKRSDSPKN